MIDEPAGLRSTFRQRNFALLWFGGLISYIGTWAMLIALPLFVFQRTQSTLASGAVLTAIFVPMLFSSIAGIYVDRWNRQRTLVVANLAMAILTLPLLIATSDIGGENLWITYASVSALAFAGLVVPPAENALLPTLVGSDQLMAANSLNALNDNIARIAGPAIGGVIAASVGLNGVVVLNTASFLVAALLIALIRSDHVRPTGSQQTADRTLTAAVERFWADWLAGLRQVRTSRVVLTVFIVAAIAMLGDAVFSALLAPFTAESYPNAAVVLGLMGAARGVGGLLGGVLTGLIGRRVAASRLLGWSAAASGAILVIFVAVPLVPVTLSTGVLLGVLAVICIASTQTLVQTNVPNEFLGRIFGAFGTSTAIAMSIGSATAALLGDRLGITNMLYATAALYALSGFVALAALPRPPRAGQATPRG